MNLLFLTQQGGFLGPFAWVMGIILDAIYKFVGLFGIHNIALCIILFTFVTRMLMLPLTIKQQKSAKLSSKMNPELTKIQAKYKGKKDQESMRRQQMEMQEVYDKYGTSPMGGCLPLLISLPIMFALYRVIYAVPAYINDVGDLYYTVANHIQGIDGYVNLITTFISEHAVAVSTSGFSEMANGVIDSKHLVDIFSKFNSSQWDAFTSLAQVQNILPDIKGAVDEIIHVNAFFGNLNILDNAGYTFPGILIPILAAGSQLLQGKLMSSNNNTAADVDNPAAQSMKTMNTVMPLVSGVFCMFLPIGVGLYWVAGSVFQIVQQLLINRYMDKVDLDEMIEKNVAKSAKKKEKYGIATGNKMAEVAKTTTKSIAVNASQTSNKQVKSNVSSNYKRGDVSYDPGSIASIANILRNKDSDKGDN